MGTVILKLLDKMKRSGVAGAQIIQIHNPVLIKTPALPLEPRNYVKLLASQKMTVVK